MSKDVEDDEMFEEWQYDLSTTVSIDFLEEELLPMLDEFEESNEVINDGYVPGTASYVLLMRLVQRLYEEGYSREELVAMIDEAGDYANTEVLH